MSRIIITKLVKAYRASLGQQQEMDFVESQGCFCKERAKRNIETLAEENYPSLHIIEYFAQSMDPLDTTFIQEVQLNELKRKVVSKRKATQEQALELDNIREDILTIDRAKTSLRDLVSRLKRLTEGNADSIIKEIEEWRIEERENIRATRTEGLKFSAFQNADHIQCSLPKDFDREMENLLTFTKKLILDVLRVQPGETLREILNTRASPAQELKHWMWLKYSSSTNTNVLGKQTQLQILADHHLPLELKKQKIQENLEILEKAGRLVIIEDYNDIFIKIANDLRMKFTLRHDSTTETERETEELRKNLLDFNDLFINQQDCIDLYKQRRKECINTFFRQETAPSHDKLQRGKRFQYTAQELLRRRVIVGNYGNKKKLETEVLTIEPEGGNVRVQLGTRTELLRLLDLLTIHNGDNPTRRVFHYTIDVSCLLFLVCCSYFGE